jgi:uncharacterized protein (DUF2132 family)
MKHSNRKTMTDKNSQAPLQGITLERILTELHARFGWDALAEKIHIRCFEDNPSIASSLKFLRRTPWARTKVERLYVRSIGWHRGKTMGKKEE